MYSNLSSHCENRVGCGPRSTSGISEIVTLASGPIASVMDGNTVCTSLKINTSQCIRKPFVYPWAIGANPVYEISARQISGEITLACKADLVRRLRIG